LNHKHLKTRLPSFASFYLIVATIGALPAPAEDADWKKLNDAGVQSYLDGEDGQAKRYFTQAIEKASHSDRADEQLSASYFGLGQVYLMQQKYEQAEELYTKALEHDEKSLQPDNPALAEKMTCLASTQRKLGQLDRAEPLFVRALAIREKALGSDDPLVGNTLLDLTTLYVMQGRYSIAEPLCKRALTIKEKTLGQDSVRLVTPLKIYANLLRKLDRGTEAAGLEERTAAIEDKQSK